MQRADAISCKVIIPAGDGALWLVKYPEGHCGLPGGRAEKGEALEVAAQREVQEEIGATVQRLQIVDARLSLNDPTRDGQDCLVLVYLAELAEPPRTGLSTDGEVAIKVPLAALEQSGLRLPYIRSIRTLQQRGQLVA